jgi:hypothetical protein
MAGKFPRDDSADALAAGDQRDFVLEIQWVWWVGWGRWAG